MNDTTITPPSRSTRVTFRTTLLAAGKTATGIVVPPEVVAELNQGKKPPVRVTIGAHTYRNTVAVMGGQFMVGVSAENRQAAGVKAGDEVEVTLELDTQVREVTVPADFGAALDAVPSARAYFDSLSFSHRRAHIEPIEQAKTDETRQRRIEKSVAMLAEGRAR
jgi:Bacteriocin-protection, YdeI or OmpD-Associated/Domain of unknown function (DUF1905)